VSRGTTAPWGARLGRSVLALALVAVLASAAAQPLVRVLLTETTSGVTVAFEGPHRGAVDGRPFVTPFALAWPVEVDGERLLVDGHAVGRQLDLAPDVGLLAFDGRRFRGTLRLLAHDGRLLAINVLDVESYLRGVVPAEMQASWPMEALKAQAVAARSYILAHVDPTGHYDICATTDCQVYRGADAEHPRTDAAVAETAGLVLTFDGRFARTYYHSDSGGVIASAQEVWGMSLPYLKAFQDVRSDGPHRRWEQTLDPAVIARSLAGTGRSVGAVRRVRVLALSESGRVARLEIVGDAGSLTLQGIDARLQARGWGLRSTRFQMVGDLVARGEGWGHGVGMSQYGARELALAGHSFGQILGFYYPSTALQRVTTVAER
jgi:stage II sporulation protein D